MCLCGTCIQARPYQEYLNDLCNMRLRFINNCEKLFMSVLYEQLNAENIASRYSEVLWPYVETIRICTKYDAFPNVGDCPDKDIKIPKWPCVLNCRIYCSGVFVLDILGKTYCADKTYDIFVSRHNNYDWNAYIMIQSDVRFLVNKFTFNTSLVVSQFLYSLLHLSILTSLNHQPYIWHNLIIICQIKLTIILALLKYIFVFFFTSLFQTVS